MKKTIMLLGILVAALIIIALVMSFYHKSTTNNQIQTSMTNETTTTTPEGLQITTVTPGTGAVAQSGDTVSVNYTGMFEDGKAFDSNIDATFKHVEPLKFTLGAGQVISGWDQGVTGMKVGEKRHLVIPSDLAYGPNGYGPLAAGARDGVARGPVEMPPIVWAKCL